MKKSLTVFPCVISAISVIYHLLATLPVNDEHNCITNTGIVLSDHIDETAPPEEEIPYVPISEMDLDEDLAFLVDYDVVVPNIYLEVEDLNGLIRETIDYGFDEEEALRQIKEKYTIGTLCDLGAARGWKAIFSDGFLVFPLSEYEELDEYLQFLNNFDIYIPTVCSPDLNELLFHNVEMMRQDISSRISEGTMSPTFSFFEDGFSSNITFAKFSLDEIFCGVLLLQILKFSGFLQLPYAIR